MNEKVAIIQKIFIEQFTTESGDDADAGVPGKVGILKHGNYYGGIHNGRKYMYSESLINSYSPEKLEAFIRNQLGI